MFFESNRSSREGLLAVGSVVMNRLHSGKWGNDICGVVGAERQFAPGVLSRPMNSKALPDVIETADAVLKGERHPKVPPNVMFFHTAGRKFPYKNMHYTTVAGGNAFYEKRDRRRMQREGSPSDASVMMAQAEPQAAASTMTALAPQSSTLQQGEIMLAMNISAVPTPRPGTAMDNPLPGVTGASDAVDTQRYGNGGTMAAAEMQPDFDTANAPAAAFTASPEQATAIGAMLIAQRSD
ncbi:MAG: cell wall hydrolase [Rhizobiaceae bacterium]|nr:cell wall hydrolase [Rhizobiaceae bacterium]